MAKLLHQRVTWRSAALVGSDSALIAGASAAMLYALCGAVLRQTPAVLWPQTLITAIVLQCCLYGADLYDPRTAADRQERCTLALQAMGAAALLLALAAVFVPVAIVARGAAVATVGVVAVWAVTWRSA